MIPRRFRVPGRPPKGRAAMARALVAKAVYDMPTTRVLLDRLDTDVVLRRICGWERRSEVPSESVFSRAFAEFSDTQLPQRVHEALIWNTHRDRLVGHLSRDSTAIEAREKPAAKEKAPPPPKRKRGRPKKGEERPKVLKRLDRQATMSLPAMLDDLPTARPGQYVDPCAYIRSRQHLATDCSRDLRDPLILSRESIRRNRSVEQTSPTGWTLHNVARPG